MDYKETLNLPKTDFPMRAGLPQKEPELLARWTKLGLYKRLRQAALGRAKFTVQPIHFTRRGTTARGSALQ